MPDLSNARVGVIGGSGLYAIPGLDQVEELSLDTPFGRPSDVLRLGTLQGMETVFLARHGRHHQLLPREVPYQANIWAMRQLNVRWLISVSAVGSLQEHLRPRDMVVPDQFIDRTQQRPQSFFGDGCVAHVSLADPVLPPIERTLGGGCNVGDAGRPPSSSRWHIPLHGGPCVLNASRKPAVPKLGMLRHRHDQSHRSATGSGS